MALGDDDTTGHFELWGSIATTFVTLLQCIADFFFGGPLAWRESKSPWDKRLGRLKRWIVARFILDYQDAFVQHTLESLSTTGCRYDYIIIQHMWDETNQMILRSVADQADDISFVPYESITAPILIMLGAFKTSAMDRWESIVYPALRLCSLKAQSILGGWNAAFFIWNLFMSTPEYRFLAVHLLLCCDDASSNRRLIAHQQNLTRGAEYNAVIIWTIICIIHRLRTSVKPAYRLHDVDSLYRWANVFRIQSYRTWHWGLVQKFLVHNFVAVVHEQPEPIHNTMFRRLLELTLLAGRSSSKYYHSLVDTACDVFKFDVRRPEILFLHPDGDRAKPECMRRAMLVTWRLLFHRHLRVPKQSDWNRVFQSACHAVLGYCLHRFFDLPFLAHNNGSNMSGMEQRARQRTHGSDVEDVAWAYSHGIRVAKTVIHSGLVNEHMHRMVFCLSVKPQCQLKGFFFETASGLHPKYRTSTKDLRRQVTWEVLTPSKSPTWRCMRETAQLLKPGEFFLHWSLVTYFFGADMPKETFASRILQVHLPMIVRQYRNVFLPGAKYDLNMLQVVNPNLSLVHRAWWNHDLLHPPCPRCRPLATRKFVARVSGGAVNRWQKRELNDVAAGSVWQIIPVEHSHGRIRALSRSQSGDCGGTTIATMRANQVYNIRSRNHDEAVALHNLPDDGEEDIFLDGLIDDLARAQADRYVPGPVLHNKRQQGTWNDGFREWRLLPEAEQQIWRDLAKGARAQASIDVRNISRQIEERRGLDVPMQRREFKAPLGLGDEEHVLLGSDMDCDPELALLQEPRNADGPEAPKRMENAVSKWASDCGVVAEDDEVLGDETPEYDVCCQESGVCRTKITSPWKSYLEAVDALLHPFRSMVRARLQDCTHLFCFSGSSTDGSVSKRTFWLAADTESDPRFTIFGVRCVLRPNCSHLATDDGSPPAPPFDLDVVYRDYCFGPPDDRDWYINLPDVLSAHDLVQSVIGPAPLTRRFVYQLDFFASLDSHGGGALFLRITGQSPRTQWWNNGPVKAKNQPAHGGGAGSGGSDLASLIGKQPPPAKPKPPARPKPKPPAGAGGKAKAKAKAKRRRKLTDEEKLELTIFGIVPPDVMPPDPEPDDHGGAPPDVHDAGQGPCGDEVEDELDILLGDPPPGGLDPPDPIDYSVGPDGYISHRAARELLGVPDASHRCSVVHPEDPSKVIGVISEPHGHGGPWAARCIMDRHKRCSRMWTRKDGEDYDAPGIFLTRWLVRGCTLGPTPIGSNPTDQHMDLEREKSGPAAAALASLGPAPSHDLPP